MSKETVPLDRALDVMDTLRAQVEELQGRLASVCKICNRLSCEGTHEKTSAETIMVLRAQIEELMREREQLSEWADGLVTETQRLQGIEQRAAQAEERVRDHHKEPCETCIACETERNEAEAKLAAAHSVMEKFADDLDTGPSTRLLATELRNRWRAALAAAEQPTQEKS